MYRGQRRLIGLADFSAIRIILFICIIGLGRFPNIQMNKLNSIIIFPL